MTTPDVTKIQGSALGAFTALVLGAPAVGYHGNTLIAVIVSGALVAAATVFSDAHIRNGRSRSK